MQRLLFALLLSLPSFGQSVAIGVKGRIRATDDLQGFATSESKRYLVGPAVEVDALYSRFGLRTTNGDFLGSAYIQSRRANSWEFPLLGKFRPMRHIFVEAGYVPRTTSGSTHFDSTTVGFAGNRTRQTGQQKTDYLLTHGLIAGGGIDLPFGRLRLSPEVRYTRWLNRSFDIQAAHGFFL